MARFGDLIKKLHCGNRLSRAEYSALISGYDEDDMSLICRLAQKKAEDIYGRRVFLRGLIEFTNFCRNDCLYCGIRNGNNNVSRYRLSKEEIIKCCMKGHSLGLRTFVLQGGEDMYYDARTMADIVSSIRAMFPDSAITLSCGERTYEFYRECFVAGADRYLLRHEAASPKLYERIHPKRMSLENRMGCLSYLKEIGYQVGAGFMVGAPFQTADDIADDILYLEKLNPHMIGIGPFIPHADTPFAGYARGSYKLTIFLIAMLRIIFPSALIPATTALGTITPKGREDGVLAGANVIMPNLSPHQVREKYTLYDGKVCKGSEGAENISSLKKRMHDIGYDVPDDRGDHISRMK